MKTVITLSGRALRIFYSFGLPAATPAGEEGVWNYELLLVP